MAKIKWNTAGAEVDGVEVEDRETFEPYDGPIPPKNTILRVELKWARVAEFSTGSGGLKLLLEVSEPKSSPKAKYNGLPLFENLVDIDTQAWKIRQFMDAIGGSGRDWDSCQAVKDDKDNQVVTKFGRIKAEGLSFRIVTNSEVYEGEKRAKVSRYVSAVDASGDDDDDDDVNDDNEPPF